MVGRCATSTRVATRHTSRFLLAVLTVCGALAGAAAAAAAASTPTLSVLSINVPTVSVPTVSVPTVSVPTVTAPTVSVPTVSVPSVTVPPVAVGPVTTPQVSTPSLTTPSVSTPSLPSTPVRTPTVGTPVGTLLDQPSRGASASAAAAPGAPTSQSAAPSVSGGSASGTRARATVGSTRRPAERTVAGGAGDGSSGRSGQTAAGTAGATAGSSSPDGRSGPARSGSRDSTGTAASTQSGGPFGRLVKELPKAVLFALLAFGVIAAAMALNAYLQRRRAKSLAGQRAALLSDVGVLQAALLPAVPERLGELGVSVAYRPAQGLAAGGDFFDVFTVSAERTGIIIGDVAGHGRESLIHAALVRYTLRTLMGEGHSLPEVLARADRYLTGELGDGFATVIVSCYEHATGKLTWAKAGHEPPIIAGEPELEEEAATPLGFGFGDTWPQFSRSLAPGERVCLFTDGLVEARRRGEYLGRAHLRSLVEQGLSAQALVDRIESDSDLCTDDLAVVVLSRAAVVAPVQTPSAPQAATV